VASFGFRRIREEIYLYEAGKEAYIIAFLSYNSYQRDNNSSLIQAGSGVLSASHTMDTEHFFARDKAIGARS
jgi:hypothetical protein